MEKKLLSDLLRQQFPKANASWGSPPALLPTSLFEHRIEYRGPYRLLVKKTHCSTLQSIVSVVGFITSVLSSMQSILLPSLHPAFIQLSAWLSAFNTSEKEALLAYHTGSNFPYSVALRVFRSPEHELRFAKATAGFEVVKVESAEDPSYIVAVLKEKKSPRYVRAKLSIEFSNPSHPVTDFSMRPIATPLDLVPPDDPRRPEYENALAPLTPARHYAVVEGISDVLREQYVNKEIGEKVIAALNSHLENGEYETFEDIERFAKRLTEDMREVGNDKHMLVTFLEPSPETNGNADSTKPQPKSYLETLRLNNFGFGVTSVDTQSSPGRSIATLPIDCFVPTDAKIASDWKEIRAAIGDIISCVADADALIVDLRFNTGGSLETVALVQSYLFDSEEPIHLLDMVDRNNIVHQSYSTLPVSALPVGTTRFGGTKPLYVLTSCYTKSGGEYMAYCLQALNRASAIIGEGNKTTVGTLNYITKPRFVAEEVFGKRWWYVGVPDLRPTHAVMGRNWEGNGVLSDAVAGNGEWEGVSDAGEVARRLAVRKLEEEK